MSRSARMANGWSWNLTGAVGGRSAWTPDGVLTATVTGRGPTPAGTGPATSRGVGPPITMAAGIGVWNWAGFGCRTRNGPQPGSLGDRVPDTSVGRPCPRPPGSERAALSRFTRGQLRHTRLSL